MYHVFSVFSVGKVFDWVSKGTGCKNFLKKVALFICRKSFISGLMAHYFIPSE